MGLVLPKPEFVPVNRVRAMDLEQALQAEFSKREWREAQAAALKRWMEEGNKITRVAASKRSHYIYTEE